MHSLGMSMFDVFPSNRLGSDIDVNPEQLENA